MFVFIQIPRVNSSKGKLEGKVGQIGIICRIIWDKVTEETFRKSLFMTLWKCGQNGFLTISPIASDFVGFWLFIWEICMTPIIVAFHMFLGCFCFDWGVKVEFITKQTRTMASKTHYSDSFFGQYKILIACFTTSRGHYHTAIMTE